MTSRQMLIAFLVVCLLSPASFVAALVAGAIAGCFSYHPSSAPPENIHFVHCGGEHPDPACKQQPATAPKP